MKINKIMLYNFNSFEGLNEFDFTNKDEEKNIILIGGKNGAGKTSLFTAIKVALYGPLAYGYVGVNPHYISKIKDCINMKAFQQDEVEAKVQLTISLTVGREVKEYIITREWDYSKQKLEEIYFVKEDGKLLDKQKLSYFQNYLQALIPLDLFEFFFFDGEEVGSIFSTSSYNVYIRNAIYTLCGLDVFEIIRKFTDGYIGKVTSDEEETFHEEYEKLCAEVSKLVDQKVQIEELLSSKNEKLEQLETELIEIETAFKNAGGITEKERKNLTREFEEAEHLKVESAAKIKMFMEGLMPFYILKELNEKISEQLDFEERGEIFCQIRQKLDRAEVKEVLKENSDISDKAIDTLVEMLIRKFKPEGYVEGSQPIHDLSREETKRVQAIMSMVDDINVVELVKAVQNRKIASDRTVSINRILKNVMADEDAFEFAEKRSKLFWEKEEIIRNVREMQEMLLAIRGKLEMIIPQRDRLLQRLKDMAQNRHVIELSARMAIMMSDFLADRTESIKRNLEHLIVEKLNLIYRKNNLITHIEIGAEFQFKLYQNALYKVEDLVNLIKNVGKEGFAETIGHCGQEKLYEMYDVNDLKALLQIIKNAEAEKKIELYKRIDLNKLSKGERQIFILSLYWAIIELSSQSIPFVIDTPYARIDKNHRKEISEKFLPSISKQVIILSTDEEINEEYYRIIKPNIAKEFLLINDESQNKTSVEEHYFFGTGV